MSGHDRKFVTACSGMIPTDKLQEIWIPVRGRIHGVMVYAQQWAREDDRRWIKN